MSLLEPPSSRTPFYSPRILPYLLFIHFSWLSSPCPHAGLAAFSPSYFKSPFLQCSLQRVCPPWPHLSLRTLLLSLHHAVGAPQLENEISTGEPKQATSSRAMDSYGLKWKSIQTDEFNAINAFVRGSITTAEFRPAPWTPSRAQLGRFKLLPLQWDTFRVHQPHGFRWRSLINPGGALIKDNSKWWKHKAILRPSVTVQGWRVQLTRQSLP